MFIERLTQKEVENFIERTMHVYCDIFESDYIKINIIKMDTNPIVANFSIGSSRTRSNYTLYLRDFMCRATNKVEEFNDSWKQFLYSKFGEEYKVAYNENLKKELKAKYEKEMIK